MKLAKVPSLETLLTAPQFWGLESASPVQRAICRVIDGLPLGDLACDQNVIDAIGGPAAIAALPSCGKPLEVDWYSGIRTFKTGLAAIIALRGSQAVGVRGVRAGEVPRFSTVSLDLDKGRVFMGHLVGELLSKPALRALMIGGPTKDSVMLRHPSGCPIEVRVVASSKNAGHLVARWSAGACFDEKPRMMSAIDGGVINYDDAAQAIAGRLLPGAQVIGIGSPWAPWGAAYDDVQNDWGKPTRNKIVVKAPAYALNPTWWTPERCRDLQEKNPNAYRTDVLAEFHSEETAVLSDENHRRIFAVTPERLKLVQCSPTFGSLDWADGGGDELSFGLWWFARPEITSRDLYVWETGVHPSTGEPVEGLRRKTDPRTGEPIMRDDIDFDPTPTLCISKISGFAGKFRNNLTTDEAYRQIAQFFIANGVRHVLGDQRCSWHAEGGLQKFGIRFDSINWTNPRKAIAVDALVAKARDGHLWIQSNDEETQRQYRTFRAKIVRSSGLVKFEGKRDDRVAVTLTALMFITDPECTRDRGVAEAHQFEGTL